MSNKMKKLLLSTSLILAGICFCQAQNVSDLFNKVASAANTSAGSGIVNTITNLIAGNNVSESQIAGTWSYSGAAISFKSENAIASLASGVAESSIESKIDTYLGKIGIKQGGFAMEFTSDGNVKMTLGGKSWSGTWTYDKAEAMVKLSFAKLINVNAHVAISAGQLKLLFEASALLRLVKSIASVSSSASVAALAGVLNSYDGLYAGFRMNK